jgi:enamine deaminase RidA (YjgF/YER057c/UK114 family)
MATITPSNPWSWQDQFGYSQAIEVRNSSRVLYCSGQTSVDDDGKPMHLDDMTKQLARALDNLEAVLGQAGLGLEDVVRLNYYATDVDALLAALAALGGRLAKLQPPSASTLLGVQRLFHPDLMVELEATAVE